MKSMLKIMLLSVFLFGIGVQWVPAQDTLTIDFRKPHSMKETFVRQYKKPVLIRITNINRFIYNINENRSDSEFNIAMPAILSTLPLPSTISNPAIHAMNWSFEAQQNKERLKTQDTLSQQILDNLSQIMQTEDTINELVNVHNDCLNLSRSCDADASSLIKETQDKIYAAVITFGIPKGTIIAMVKAWENDVNKAIFTANRSFQQLASIYKKWKIVQNNFENSLVLEKTLSLVDAKFQLDRLADAEKEAKTEIQKKKALDTLLKQQKLVTRIQSDIDRTTDSFQDNQKSMDDLIAKAKSLLDEINGYQNSGKIFTLGDDLKKINLSNYTYYSEVFKPKTDILKFTFPITTKDLSVCDKINEDQIQVQIKTKGGWKIDFSTGVFVNWGTQDFYGRTFYYKPQSDSVSVIATPSVKTTALLSIGALMHFYKRSPSKVKLGGSIGASLSTGETVINLHIGPSIIFWNENRLILTGGLTLRQGTLLDPSYSTSSAYTTSLLPATVPTITKFPMVGCFIALTYNLSSL
jgi:hypothetical protein